MSEPIECNFCGKSREEVAKLVSGKGTFICDECLVVSFATMIGSPVKFLTEDAIREAIEKGKAETRARTSVQIEIERCEDCPFISHSGGYTPGERICCHSNAVESVVRFSGEKKLKDKRHWKHRRIKGVEIPNWCPLREGVSR